MNSSIMALTVVAYCVFLNAVEMNNNKSESYLKRLVVEDGLFKYDDGKEVSLWGTYYFPMSWTQYVHMRALDADFRQEIAKDIADMKNMGIQIVAVHFFDTETSDIEGNLLDTDHLHVFDIFVDELNKQGVYLFLTLISWCDSPSALPDSFARHTSKMSLIYREEALSASERFMKDLLNHKNRFTGRAVKDEPCLAVLGLVGEPYYWPYAAVEGEDFSTDYIAQYTRPEIFERDLAEWKSMWYEFCQKKNESPSAELYEQFEYKTMTAFLERMITAVRETGAKQPIASALFDTYRCPGILRAIGDSAVDAVTDGWYPGAFHQLNEEVNQLGTPEAQAYQLPDNVRQKAKMVYEFDICNTYNNVSMYPAMARRYRSMGAQIVCQFQYDAAITASYNVDWGHHYLNYLYTPAKAVAFSAAADTFAAIPLGESYPQMVDNEVFHGTVVSFEHMQVMRVSGDKVWHAHPIDDWQPLELPDNPHFIMGRGSSPYVHYEGTGLYIIHKISEDEIQLTVTPNTVLTEPVTLDFFWQSGLDKPKVVLNEEPLPFTLRLPGWDDYRVDDSEQKVEQGTFLCQPGRTYTLHRNQE